MRQIKRNRFFIAFFLFVSMLFQMTVRPVIAQENVSEENGVTVYTREEFMAALEGHKSPITIGSGMISIGNQAEASGRMLPVMIPGGTVIRGAAAEDENGNVTKNEICSRSPIQLEGDGVVFENMKLTFESSDALGSVPHREIFLAGHSLTLDNVSTYLKGDGGSMGPMGSSEKELLPSVYGGGYPGTSVGTNASLTVQNCKRELEDSSVFQGIYMGHEEGVHGNVPYNGTAQLNLEPSVLVRDGIHVNQNSMANVCITGSGMLRDLALYGNRQTTFRISQSTLSDAVIEQVGSLILDDSAWFAPKTAVFYDVSLKNNACLDFSQVQDAFILGDFKGQDTDNENAQEQTGLLVLSSDGRLDIGGAVTGQTRFWSQSRTIPGTLFHKWPYIIAGRESEQEKPFVLSEKDIESGFSLDYIDGAWTAWNDSYSESVEIGGIEILSSPSAVDVSTIAEKDDGSIPNEGAFCKVIWRDKNGDIIADEDVVSDEMLFYEFDYVVCIKTEYWESEDPAVLEKTDWYNSIYLIPSEEHPGNYYICSIADKKAFTGEYTLLFCSDYFSDLDTVADVKQLKDTVKAECKILFFDSTEGTTDLPSVHMHTYDEQIMESATCSKVGKKTLTCTFAGCSETYTIDIPKTAHTIVNDEREEATCTKEGKTAGSHCSVCNAVIREQRTIPMTGHMEMPDLAIEATCTKEGKTAGSHCSVCQEVIKAQETIPKTAHVEVTVPGREATCTEEGRTQEKHCSICNQVTDPGQVIPKTAHDERTQVTKASINKNGYERTECNKCRQVLSEYVIVSPKTVALSSDRYVYDGTQKCPAVTVADKNGRKIDRKYYTVDFRNNKDVGLAEVRVVFRGNYEGVLTETFQILPKPVAVKKLKATKKGFTVKWKKQTTQITGYVIQYSLNKKFSSKATKLITVNKSNASSKKVKKLKAGKKYFVRICAYKTVQSGGQREYLCSKWSKAKAVKVKN